jgi:hypothetical protein
VFVETGRLGLRAGVQRQAVTLREVGKDEFAGGRRVGRQASTSAWLGEALTR